MPYDLSAWLVEQAPPRKVFATSPLVLTLCQINFNVRPNIRDESIIQDFHAAIAEDYPVSNSIQQVEAEFEIGGSNNQGGMRSDTRQTTIWQFSDPSEDWIVSLSANSVSLQTRRYQRFEEFGSRLLMVLNTLFSMTKPIVVQRIGLRYIDEIVRPDADWKNVIRSEALGLIRVDPFREAAQQSIQLLTLQSNGSTINVQQGVFPSGSTVTTKRNAVLNPLPFYLLDIDMFQAFESAAGIRLNPKAMHELISEFHDTASALFRWVTTDEFRHSLEAREV
jgi:uncharacterized protein (TIGR04255 family)